MGVMNHNAVLATTNNPEEIVRMKKWIFSTKTVPDYFRIMAADWNGYETFILAPDGSKEGWPESDEGDKLRAAFIRELKKADYEDGSSPWDWVEVGYGEFGQKVLRGNCKNQYDDRPYCE